VDRTHTAKNLRQNMTDAEQRLWRHLRAGRLNGHKLRRQQPIGPYVVDFVHFGARLVVEADGGQHNGSKRDIARDAWLRDQGFHILRFWNHDIVTHTEAVLTAILDAAEARRKETPLPSLSPRGSGAGGEGDEQTQTTYRVKLP